jgi:hypothetical protein
MRAPSLEDRPGRRRATTAGESLTAGSATTAGRLKRALRTAPSPWRRGRSGRPERYYIGRRPEATEVYVVSGTEPQRLAHLCYQGTAAFDWGCVAPGSLELAFAMLAHTTERPPTDLVCRAFCDDVVARLDHAGFVLIDGDIAVALMTAFVDSGPSTAEPQSGRGTSRWQRTLAWIRSIARRG